ncbi:Type II secretion system F domain protein [Solidesulfovibrio fructosivorans JJ]]|uniref:Type II secretion system F domain protein n=1 Tax=Solidesulfovibrio fructosivorans JJ] TaxID=596151 RepID=E1K0G0_SOLFR|nr:type II secretion system F family protein [Solidesulfovibrio fructosivorans]EFL49903.1 Type II secretion system F domain protein [Solidesulfovibrio fructosivorans JJ]]
MPQYSYEAINEAGNTIRGVLEADSPDGAKNRLSAMGYIPVSVQRGLGGTGRGTLSSLEVALSRVKPQELILFTKQFKTMLAAGLSMLEILKVLEQQTENPRLRRICGRMADDVKKGASISEALAEHKGVFSPLYVSMVRAGETAGALPEVLDRLIYIISHEHQVRADIRSALQYPLTVVIALVGAFFFLLTFVVPVFAKIFASAHVELPLPTRIALYLNVFITHYWYALLGGVLAVIASLYFWFKTEGGKVARDAFFLHIPIIGKLFQKAAMSRFASIFAILQSSGVPVLTTIDILVETIGNAAISKEFRRVQDMIRTGQGLSAPLSRAKYFTPMVVTMVSVGEESGNLDDMLSAISEHYDAEVAYAVKRLSDALGPVLIVGLAGVVGFFALAIFLPMWDLSQVALRH